MESHTIKTPRDCLSAEIGKLILKKTSLLKTPDQPKSSRIRNLKDFYCNLCIQIVGFYRNKDGFIFIQIKHRNKPNSKGKKENSIMGHIKTISPQKN